MTYDITDPTNASYVNYINTRDFSEDPNQIGEEISHLTGDVAPEGMYFISAENSPSKTPILLCAFEVSGTVSAYSVGEMPIKVEDNIEDDTEDSKIDNTENDIENETDNTENITSDEIEAPKTGDTTSLVLVVVLVLTGVGCIVFGYLSKKNINS